MRLYDIMTWQSHINTVRWRTKNYNIAQ